MSPAPVVIVTGTGTDVGKTIATAAITVGLKERGLRVVVVKPTQTGLQPAEPGDLDVVRRLAGEVETREFVRLPDPLAPDAAARLARLPLPPVAEHAARLADLAHRDDVDVVLVEGAGGLVVRLDRDGGTLADIGLELGRRGLRVGYVVIAAAGLGSLNHSALTAEALRHRGLDCIGFVVGSWPRDPDLAMRCNLEDLPAVTGSPLLGRLPQGAGTLSPNDFRQLAGSWISMS